ncbi:MAG: carboxypeptidase-like regulatory domain-containing protein [Cytophagales bacterium]|nr:carboxypeptidase-like regulatory domain-containing protein [Cytophagales bacterium]
MLYALCAMLLCFSQLLIAQQKIVVVKGRITDAQTADGLPFVNVYFKGTTIGTTTDFEGYYRLSTDKPTDSLVASYIGYITKVKAVKLEKRDWKMEISKVGFIKPINFQLESAALKLKEVVVVAGENPAFATMRKVIKNKSKNDKRSLSAYEYESYNKIELDIDNITDKFRNKKIMRKITSIFDSLQQLAGEDGRPVLPVFVSESISKYHYRDNPKKSREDILHTKITGVGLDDGTLVSQIIGTSFQQYNFYENWLSILEKDFVSPIADGWRLYYQYLLADSMFLGNEWCYKIEINPKRPQDLAFWGTIWIADTSFALKRIDVTVGKSANLNYIEKIKIQQELKQTEAGAWLPVKNRVLIDIAEVKDDWAGMLAKFYTSNRNFKVNEPKDIKFYEDKIVVAEDALQNMDDNEFWAEQRHDTLTATDRNVYDMIDTLRNMPLIKTYIDIIDIIVNGYYSLGKIDLGSYAFLYTYNNIEHSRIRIGFRTNYDFSKKLIFKGYVAYGTFDRKWKYDAKVRYIASFNPRTEMGFGYKYDLRQVGLTDEIENNLFLAFSNYGVLSKPFYSEEKKLWIQSEFVKGITEKITFKNYSFIPQFDFQYPTPEPNGGDTVINDFVTTEVTFESRFAKDEAFIQNDNERISLGAKKWPILTIRYTLGISNVLFSDFDYHKVTLNISDKFRLGQFGISYYSLTAGHIFSVLPYPLLAVHLGNETPFYNRETFNLMNYFEFVSDSYVWLNYRHHFNGLIFNRIPLFKKLKWRAIATANVLFGGVVREDNIPKEDQQFGTLDQEFKILKIPGVIIPYVEVSYGIENILRLFRVEAFHRLTYYNKTKYPHDNNFGIRFSVQFRL